jgi:tRNA(fMet)-specific endonuclease VapC
MPASLLDTDILSEILKQKNAVVTARAVAYLHLHQVFTFSAMTRYEILRGLKAKNATKQLQRFAVFCRHSNILPLTDAIFDRAADLWVTTHAVGRPKKDADLLIAATALEHGLNLATGNTQDFSWITWLTLEDWRKP